MQINHILMYKQAYSGVIGLLFSANVAPFTSAREALDDHLADSGGDSAADGDRLDILRLCSSVALEVLNLGLYPLIKLMCGDAATVGEVISLHSAIVEKTARMHALATIRLYNSLLHYRLFALVTFNAGI